MEDDPHSASSSASGSGSAKKGDGAGVTFGEGIEKFSGLRIAERRLRPARWDEMMSGRRFLPFDQLTKLESLASDSSKDVVLIGVVYEKSLAKTGASGNRYCHWSFTDLSFPQPNVITLLLLGQAFETWEGERESPVANGSMFAVLNPVLLPKRSSEASAQEGRAALKIGYGTQLVCLGLCPSLGHCQCRKKDGMYCSMPCDRDRGPLVCYYHTVQQAAQTANQWKKRNAASGTSAARSDGIFVMEAPRARVAAPKPSPRAGSSAGQFGTLNQRGQMTNTVTPPSAVRPQTRPHKPSPDDGVDAATRRLLGLNPGSQKGKTPGSGSKPAATATSSNTGRPLATPARAGGSEAEVKPVAQVGATAPATPVAQVGATSPATPVSSTLLPGQGRGVGIVRHAEEERERRQKAAIQQLIASGPKDPDPNHPWTNAEKRPVWTDASAPSTSDRCSPAHIAPATTRPAASTTTRRPSANSASNRSSAQAAAQGPRKTGAAQKRLEAEFGARIAMQLNELDPRKDLARKQGSRFQSAVEEERVAKRRRLLGELERQDAMIEKMEALMEITVQAWRCPECDITTESMTSKAFCEQQGHHLSQIQAKRTNWECKNCKWTQLVLNRDLPAQCSRCNGVLWTQVPLQRARRAPMERELLLPRGEELPFLNSIPKPFKEVYSRVKEAGDDYADIYAGLSTRRDGV